MGDGTPNPDPVEGGWILLARSIRHSPVWEMDSHHLRLWVYLLTSVHAREKPKRVAGIEVGYGQTLKSYRKISDENEWLENKRKRRWSKMKIARMLAWMERERMVDLLVTELGTVIEVRNFARFQNFRAYNPELVTGLVTERVTGPVTPPQSHKSKGGQVDTEPPEGDLLRTAGQSRDNNNTYTNYSPPGKMLAELEARYSAAELAVLHRAIADFRRCRKSGKMAESVILAQFRQWDTLPTTQVVAGLRTYVEKRYADEGKDEKYAWGIIRKTPEQPAASKRAERDPQRITRDQIVDLYGE